MLSSPKAVEGEVLLNGETPSWLNSHKQCHGPILVGIDLGNGSVRKTSYGSLGFLRRAQQQLVFGSGYFESTASYYNPSIGTGGSAGAGGALVVGTGGWAAIYENGQGVADTYPIQNITGHTGGTLSAGGKSPAS